MTTPNNGDVVSSSSTPIQFGGHWLSSNTVVELQSASSPDGPFSTFATATSADTGLVLDGVEFFAWSGAAIVPGWVPTADCGGEVWVRALGGGYTALTFDNAAAGDGVSGIDCVGNEISAGTDPVNAALLCQSDDAPVVHLTAESGPTTYAGDVVVSSQAEADALGCYDTIQGSLTVADDPTELSIALPNLQVVQGSVDLVYSRDPASPETAPVVRTIDLPALAEVGGDLRIHYEGTQSDLLSLNVGMPGLQTLGGHLSVDVTTFNTTLTGLPGLTTVNGSVTVTSTGEDFSMGSFVPSLELVLGDVSFTSFGTSEGLFDAVQTVEGSVSIEGAFLPPGEDNFRDLVSVQQDLKIEGGSLVTVDALGHQFPALTSVGWELDLEGAGGMTDLLVGDTAGLSVGALRLHQNPSLVDLSVTHVDVAGTGAISITDNSALGDCDAQAFVDEQAAAGWSGFATVAGNGGC